jgi:putative ABC transport system permease protein
VTNLYDSILVNVKELPGVQFAAVSDSLPPNLGGEDDTFSIAGRPWSDQEFPSTTIARVSPDFFRALAVPLVRGRFFTEGDNADSVPVTIISASLARKYFGNMDPIGQKIRASGPTNTDPYMEIVGVVGDLKYWGTERDARPAYYVPYRQAANSTMYLVVQSSRGLELLPEIERRVHELDRDAVVQDAATMEELVSASINQPRFRTAVVLGFSILALLLASVGIYGVMAFSVAQRTQEIGIRIALGAQRSDVLTMVLKRGAFLAGAGVLIGSAGSLATATSLKPFLFSIDARDPLVFAAGCTLLFAIALGAALIPALRATRIDPLLALRHE